MKITIERAVILKVLSHVNRAVERRNTIPILANVLIRASAGKIELKAIDLDIEIAESAPAVTEDGETTVNSSMFFDIVRKLPDGSQVVLESSNDKNTLTIRGGRSRFTLHTIPSSDFPDLNIGDMTHTFDLSSETIQKLFGRTLFAIATEEARYYLNGIYIHTGGKNGSEIIGVATDGHRLAKVTVDGLEGSNGMPGIIVPRKTVTEVLRLSEDVDTVSVRLSSSKIEFTCGGAVLRSKLIDGTFPDYNRVIPAGNNKIAFFDRKDVAAAADRVSTVSSERGRAVKFSLKPGQIELSVNNADAGSAVEDIAVDYDADPIDIGFNSIYIAYILREIVGDRVKVELGDPGSPALFSSEESPDSIYVLMPMRV